jgi:hypothetical protein
MNSATSDEDGKSCPLCTYGNKINATVCLMCETRLEVVVKHERLKAEANKESPPKPKRESSPKREAFNLIDLCATSESDYDQNEDNEEEEDDQIEIIQTKQLKREKNWESGSDENEDEDDVTWSEAGEQSGSDELVEDEDEEEEESEDDLVDTDDETPRKLQKLSGSLSDVKKEGKVKKQTRVNGDDDIEEYESESDILSFSGFHQKSSSRSSSTEKKPSMKRELTLAFPDVSQHFWYY